MANPPPVDWATVFQHPLFQGIGGGIATTVILGPWLYNGAPLPGYGKLLAGSSDAALIDISAIPSPNSPPSDIFGYPGTLCMSAIKPSNSKPLPRFSPFEHGGATTFKQGFAPFTSASDAEMPSVSGMLIALLLILFTLVGWLLWQKFKRNWRPCVPDSILLSHALVDNIRKNREIEELKDKNKEDLDAAARITAQRISEHTAALRKADDDHQAEVNCLMKEMDEQVAGHLADVKGLQKQIHKRTVSIRASCQNKITAIQREKNHEILVLKHQLVTANDKEAALKKELGKVQQERDAAQDWVQAKDKDYHKLEASSKQNIDELQREKDATLEHLSQKDSELDTAKADAKSRSEELAKVQQERDCARQEIHTKDCRYRELEASSEQKIKELQQEKDDASKELTQKNADLTAANNEGTALRKQLLTTRQERNTAREEVRAKDEAYRKLEASSEQKIAEVQKEKNEISARMEQEALRLAAYRKQNEDQQRELRDNRTAKDEEVDELRRESDDAFKNLRRMNEELTAAEARIEEQQKEFQDYQTAKDDELNKLRDEKHTILENLKQKNAELNAEKEHNEEQLREFRQRQTARDEEVNKLRREKHYAMRNLEKKDEELNAAKEQNEQQTLSFRQHVTLSIEGVRRLHDEIDDIRKTLMEKGKELAAAEERNEQAIKDLKQKDAELTATKMRNEQDIACLQQERDVALENLRQKDAGLTATKEQETSGCRDVETAIQEEKSNETASRKDEDSTTITKANATHNSCLVPIPMANAPIEPIPMKDVERPHSPIVVTSPPFLPPGEVLYMLDHGEEGKQWTSDHQKTEGTAGHKDGQQTISMDNMTHESRLASTPPANAPTGPSKNSDEIKRHLVPPYPSDPRPMPSPNVEKTRTHVKCWWCHQWFWNNAAFKLVHSPDCKQKFIAAKQGHLMPHTSPGGQLHIPLNSSPAHFSGPTTLQRGNNPHATPAPWAQNAPPNFTPGPTMNNPFGYQPPIFGGPATPPSAHNPALPNFAPMNMTYTPYAFHPPMGRGPTAPPWTYNSSPPTNPPYSGSHQYTNTPYSGKNRRPTKRPGRGMLKKICLGTIADLEARQANGEDVDAELKERRAELADLEEQIRRAEEMKKSEGQSDDAPGHGTPSDRGDALFMPETPSPAYGNDPPNGMP